MEVIDIGVGETIKEPFSIILGKVKRSSSVYWQWNYNQYCEI